MITELSPEKIELIVKKIIDLHSQNEGATVNAKAESLLKQKLFSVSVFTEVSRTFKARYLPEQIVRNFVKTNVELLKHSFCAVGTWFEPHEGRTYLDVCVVTTDENVAVALGNEYNQKAIFDLYYEKTIWLDGDGTTPEDKRDLSDAEILDFVSRQMQE